MAEPKLVIFDWDGTLMDSASQIVHCMQLAADECKVPIPSDEAVRHIIGLGLPEALAILFPGESEIRHRLIRDRYAFHFVAESGGESRLFPGARELLDDLLARGHLLAVATGKSRLGLDRVLKKTGLTHRFNATRCADETLSKPNPRMLRELLHELKMTAAQSVMIGDTTYDMEMAQLIEMPRIGVSYGVHSVAQLQYYRPLAVVDSISTLAAQLSSL